MNASLDRSGGVCALRPPEWPAGALIVVVKARVLPPAGCHLASTTVLPSNASSAPTAPSTLRRSVQSLLLRGARIVGQLQDRIPRSDLCEWSRTSPSLPSRWARLSDASESAPTFRGQRLRVGRLETIDRSSRRTLGNHLLHFASHFTPKPNRRSTVGEPPSRLTSEFAGHSVLEPTGGVEDLRQPDRLRE